MSYSSEDETDISDSELEEYVDRCYKQLKDESRKVKYSTELFRCPYCPGKKKLVYPIKDLLQHASDLSKGSQNKGIKHKGKHLGLLKFIKNDLEKEDLSSNLAELSLQSGNDSVELFVLPWMGILANVDIKSISTIKNDLTKRGFGPIRIRPLPTGKYAVVEFTKDWSGFYKAIMLEKESEIDHIGKKDYFKAADTDLADQLYFWLARGDDYNSKGILGEYLHKYGDLKTLGEVEDEEKRKIGLLIANLNNTIDELRMRVDELEGN